MALPGSGPLSLANVAIEFGDTAPYSMSEFYRGGGKVSTNNTNVPTSGVISFSNFYNAVATFIFSPTITTNTPDYNIKSAAIAAGWDQVRPLIATITINSGVAVGSTSTSTHGLSTGSTFPSGTELYIINNGYILGRGGNGGSGGYLGNVGANGGNGAGGGPALLAQFPITITNTGIIGGGGGGGGGQGTWQGFTISGSGKSAIVGVNGGGGGGGGAGYIAGSGGSPGADYYSTYPYNYYGTSSTAGGSGGLTSGGGGGYNGYGTTYYAGAGGSLGSSGGTGSSLQSAQGYYAGVGGPAGAAVNGNSNITWITTGTRYGAINS